MTTGPQDHTDDVMSEPADARVSVEAVLALRGSGWEGDLEQLRADWSRTG